MGNVFYAVFGICRRRGGTKKKCYAKAIEVIGKPTKKRKTKKNKRKTKKRTRR